MIEADLLQGIRGLLIVMMIGVIASLTLRWWKLRKVMPAPVKYTLGGIICLLLAGIGNQEKFLRDHADPSIMTWLSLLGLVFLVASQLEPWSTVSSRYRRTEGLSADLRDVRLERAELADRLYDCVRKENELSLEVMELRLEISHLKQEDRI